MHTTTTGPASALVSWKRGPREGYNPGADEARKQRHRDAHAAVVAAGVAAGYWTVEPRDTDASFGHEAHDKLRAGGVQFTIYSGGYGHEGKVTLRGPGRIKGPHGLDAQVRGVEASASLDRAPSAVAKSLHARVIAHPDLAEALREAGESLAQKVAQREALQGHVDALLAQGWTLHHPRADPPLPAALPLGEHWQATVYRAEPYCHLRLNATGKFEPERLGSLPLSLLPLYLKLCEADK